MTQREHRPRPMQPGGRGEVAAPRQGGEGLGHEIADLVGAVGARIGFGGQTEWRT